MKIIYIQHSSFFVELEHVTMLFDYTEGRLPEFPKDKPLLVFASHRHGDHYSEKVFEFMKIHENIQFILSDDIWVKSQPKEILEKLISMKPGDVWEDRQVRVQTYRSTDEGVAFLIQTEGKTIYHGGDLNNWRWEGEPDSWNDSMAGKYSQEVDKLAGRTIDAAFLPLDPRQEEDFYLGFDEFMRKVSVTHAFPMHCWGNFSVIKKLKEMDISADYRDRIADIAEDGDSFEI